MRCSPESLWRCFNCTAAKGGGRFDNFQAAAASISKNAGSICCRWHRYFDDGIAIAPRSGCKRFATFGNHMMPRSSWNAMRRDRLTAFSDGVIAIIITIMVLDLKVPQGTDLKALTGQAPIF